VRKVVIVFDISSSTTILEDLKRSDNLTVWRDFHINLKTFLRGKTDLMEMEMYKFMVLHVVPLSSMSPGLVRDVTAGASKLTTLLRPIQESSYTGRYNLDGFFVEGMRRTASYPGMPSYGSYVQVFRSGAIEAGEGGLVFHQKLLPSLLIEELILKATDRFLDALKKVDTPLPIFAMLTLMGVKGMQMAKGSLVYYDPGIIDRDLISLPEVVIEDFDIDVARLLQPMFDAMWQAAGIERSPNYDENGNRTRR
jgi:hypothetical protein